MHGIYHDARSAECQNLLIVLRETQIVFLSDFSRVILRLQNVDVSSVYKLHCVCYIFFLGNI
jgi:alpha-D-ribose 1-methylphosphonate 5-triphosphate synthase subunit PhnL